MTRVLRTTGAALLLSAAVAFAQAPPEVSYGENFQSYKAQTNPPGWIDTAVGTPRPEALGLFKTWPEPLDNKSSNIVYGTKQASGTPEGRNPRIGAFSTLGTYQFSGQGRFEYRGRVIRTHEESRVGLTFFSSYPAADSYYLIGLWSQPSGTALTMQLFAMGGGAPSGTLDSNTTLAPNKWYRFLIQVDDAEGATKIRARFWLDGTPEPETFSIEASDPAEGRLRTGRIGMWTAVRGEAYVDDLTAKSPVDHTAPTITLYESGQPLPDGAKFNRDATPEIRVSDDLSTVTYSATLDGAPYTSLTPVTTDGWHVLAVTAADGPRNVSTLQITFLTDKLAPGIALLEGTAPLVAGTFFNRDVVLNTVVTDVSETVLTATLDGQPYLPGTPITAEGTHALVVEATDAVGWKTTAGPVAFTIDKTPPQLTFTSHQDGAVLTSSRVRIAGGSDDAVSVTVASLPAVVDAAAKVYTSPELSLLEGENVLLVTGVDRAGNTATAVLRLHLDTRAPALTLSAPADEACLDTAALEVSGSAVDPRLSAVKVTAAGTTVVATVSANGAFSASVPVATEGKHWITVEATDAAGHTATTSRAVSIDRTAPVIEIRENGAPFTGGVVNRPVALSFKAADGDTGAVLTAKVDGSAYVSATPVAAEGAHTLAVTARDCAGHTSEKSVEFTIDVTAPTIRSLAPSNGATLGTLPAALGGATDADVVSVSIAGTDVRAVPDGTGVFSLPAPFLEGVNRFTIEAVDRAGNRASLEYTLTVRTSAPIVEIRESGSPIAAGALYNRAVTPAIRSVDPQATVSATLNGAAYTSGTTIPADGGYTLSATATDALGHTGSAQATFTIDRTPPAVDITSPAASTVQSDRVTVTGTAGDSVGATLNGQPLTLGAGGAFVFENFPLEVGANALVVVGLDRAGNAGRDEVLVTRDDLGAGVLLTYPPDRSRTNRPATDVIGRLLTPGKGTAVRVGSTPVEVDPTGMFRLSGYALTEGENTITVTATAANGFATSASVRVTGDFTPPALAVLESGQPLVEGARFAERAVISLQASDSAGEVVNELTIDGVKVSSIPYTITAAGGHSLVAVARDLAGNETRVERTLSIGAGGPAAGCTLDRFDPADGSVILAGAVDFTGRSGGAIGVKVNGVRANIADGSFCVDVELPVEGPNSVTVVCTDADGNPTGTPKTITLVRATGEPSIALSAPAEEFVTAQETITVSGTVSADVVTADVNGVPATITGTSFTVANVRLAAGLNMLVAHARNAGGRMGTASRRGVYLKDAPSISISAPSAGAVTGTPHVAVTGTFTNLDPSTLVVTNLLSGQSVAAQATRFGDTAGSFSVDVALVGGEQTLRVSGRDRLNREATATVTVRLTAGTPGITIAQPAPHAYFGGGADSFTVGGTFDAAAGSLVDVNGVAATITGATYSATVKFSALAGGITPVVARVTQPDGASATASTIVTQLAAAPSVVETFPAAAAVEVDRGALLLVLFSQPMDAASLVTAFRLEDAAGAQVSGATYVDKDVLTFAPATLLAAGARYTIRVTTAAKNLAGTPLATDHAAGFTTATTAPAAPPSVDAIAAAVCGQSLTVRGTAAPGARLRLEAGTLTLSATADAAGAFAFSYPLSGQSGFLVLRVRTVGSDGTLSPAADVKVRVDCSGPQVLSAAFDATVNQLTIQFSEDVDAATVAVGQGSDIVLTLEDGRIVGGTAAVAGNIVTVTPAEALGAKTFTLAVDTRVKDTVGNPLVAPFSQVFAAGGSEPVAGDGSGFISGEVYDATTGRPLAGARITIAVPAGAPVSTSADARGRYLVRLREGAHTIKASLAGYTSVWRQIIVPAGAGAIPIDIRLTRRGEATPMGTAALTLTHGGDTAVTKPVGLTVPAAALNAGRKVSLTAIGGQALIGLLPLGWSPIAAAEIAVDGAEDATPLPGAQLTFQVPLAAITAATQTLAAVQYDAVRDEWRVLASAVNVASDGQVTVAIPASGAYALVYPDKAAALTQPPLPVAGDVLGGVPAAPAGAGLTKRDFQLDPPVVLPTGRTVATLRIEGGASFPSGTAVQAYIDEELRLADGTRLLDPPFATDLLLYRTLSGDLGVADFHLAPSTKAAEVILEVGVDRIRVFPYPGRLDRGTLIGPEGGRVPADDKVSVEIAAGAVAEPMRATATALSPSDLTAIGSIAGFRVVGGFQLTLQRVTQPVATDLDGDGAPDPIALPELFVPARVTFTLDAATMPAPTSQVVLAELLDQTPYGRMLRLAVPMMLVDPTHTGTPALRFTTASIDRSVLPVDGVAHEGRYVLLAAEAPVAFATGTVRLGAVSGRLLADARVLAPALGVAELTRPTGIYNIPVPARPAAPFTLVPRHTMTGDGTAYTHASAVDPASASRVDLVLVPQPPVLGAVVVLKGEPPSQATLNASAVTSNVSLTTNIRASFSPAIDPASVTADSITITEALTGKKVPGAAAADGTVAVVWTLKAGERLAPNGSYIVSISPTIRGTNGAALGRSATFNFETVTEILNSEIHRERIRITIPDANGLSTIAGAAGALPAGWQAVAVRRNRDFLVRYQTTAANDGSFSFVIGNAHASDKVTMADLIDLQVIGTTGNVAAIFALTPFTSEDGQSFVVPAGAAIRYTTPEGLTLDVPEGAFDEATVIRMTAMRKEDFQDIEYLDRENGYIGSVNIDFEGTAKKPLGFEAPLPAGLDTAGKTFVITQKGMSPLGPRLALIDLMQARGGKLVIDHDNVTASAVVLGPGKGISPNQTLTGSKFSKYLMMLIRGGAYMYQDIKVYGIGGAVGFAAMENLQTSYDMIWDIYWSYYIPHIHVTERGGAVFPIISGRRFTVTGFDPGTGLQAVSRTYDPIPFGEPGTVMPVPSTEQNYGGPYPVYGGPFRVELLDLEVEDVDLETIRNFKVRLERGSVTVSPGASPLESDIKVTLLNASKGEMVQGTAGSALTLPAEAGHRVVLLIEERRVDSRSALSVVFSEPIYTGEATDPASIDRYLYDMVKVAYATASGDFADITDYVRFSVDSGRRRVNIALPTALQSEARYRVTLQPDIADIVDGGPGLGLAVGTDEVDGQRIPVGGGFPLELFFDVRKPAGALQSFSAAPHGLIRGMELAGNVLFVAAQDGGLRSYDVSNPAASMPALGYLPGPPESGSGHLAVTVDRHNRVYATAQQPASGAFRSYRVEDFLGGGTNIPVKGSKLINWKIGFSQGLGLPSNTLLSDIPESIPFRIKVVLQDDEQNFADRKAFLEGTGASESGNYPTHDLKKYTLTVGGGGDYAVQRITVENVTLDMRWSADAPGGSATIENVVARSTDRMRVIRNLRTYAIVAHLGYGIAVYDANAIEHNRYLGLGPTHPAHLREQLVLTNGLIDRICTNDTPDYGIVENYITTDAELAGDSGSGKLYSYSVSPYHGVLDLELTLPSSDGPGTRDNSCEQRPDPNTGGLLLQARPSTSAVPRMQAVRGAIAAAAGRDPIGHFGALARYQWSITAAQNKYGTRGVPRGRAAQRDYLLVAGGEFGLIVVEVESRAALLPRWPLTDAHVADVIWIPGGVHTVRAYPSANVAVVGDRYGRVVLVDLSRIDERWDADNNPYPSGVFPTLAKALQGPSDGYGIGADDPRILWKSPPGMTLGAAAPVFDPNTGMLFGANVTQVKAFAGVDPKVEMKVNLGESGGMSTVGGVVPLGVPLPANVERFVNTLPACDGTTLACKENASLAAFKLEVSLPGDMVNALTNSQNELRMAVESERILDAVTEQTPSGFPRAHFRRTRRDGSSERRPTNFKFTRVVPDELGPVLKNQRGYNRFVSPWIVAIADPRAADEYVWRDASTKQEKKEKGCDECERPDHLKHKTESEGVYELWTNGRYIAVRPELSGGPEQTIFEGTQYSYLGMEKRLLGRFSTVMADTVRSTDAVAAGQNPAVASGALEETTYVHSGEVESSALDLNAGGRAGSNVTYDRMYRSRTLGGTVFGQGWDSSMLRRLRALPNGDVEYRDGADVWRFRSNPATGYDSPKGLYLKLSRTSRGWTITDQSWQVAEFDDLGRLLSEADEFYTPQEPGSGNIIRYLYDAQGRLSRILDPVKRESILTYWGEDQSGGGAYPGMLRDITDWRGRKVEYEYDASAGTLVKVKLPEVANTSGGRPAVEYTYAPQGGSYSDNLELRTNLESIKEPHEVLAGGPARVRFTYNTGGDFRRDRVVSQQWGTGESASFDYPSKVTTNVTDALGQTREYTMNAEPPKDYFADRPHIQSLSEKGVRISSTPFGQLPQSVSPGAAPTTSSDRTTSYTYGAEGQLLSETLAGVRSVTYGYIDVRPAAPGLMPAGSSATSLAGPSAAVSKVVAYQSGANRSTFVKSISANGLTVDAPEPSRSYRDVSASNDSIQSNASFDSSGQQTQSASTGGTDPAGGGATVKAEWGDENAAKHVRGMLLSVDSGGLKTTISYPSPTQMIESAPRGVTRTTTFDDWDRLSSVTINGPQLTVSERYEYDASGRLTKQVKQQGGTTVTETFAWDVMNRPTSYSVDNVAGAGTAVTRTAYNLQAGTIVTTLPSGAVSTTTLDGLGRAASRETTTGSAAPLKDTFAYDLLGNVVYTSDGFNASAKAFDANGQLVGSMGLDGVKTRATVDGWGRVTGFLKEDARGATIAESSLDFTANGRLKSVTRKREGGDRTTTFTWDGGGRATGTSVAGRAQHTTYDQAGRVQATQEGAGSAAGVSEAFHAAQLTGHSGTLPQSGTSQEKGGSGYALSLEYNTLGDSLNQNLGGLEWNRSVDQAGNVTSFRSPSRPALSFQYDSRHRITTETLGDGGVNTFGYNPSGALAAYTDPSSEVTETTSDLLGRTKQRKYRDGSTEQVEWEGRRVKSITDRGGRVQNFVYNGRGQLAEVRASDGSLLERLEYDDAGRVVRWSNADAVLEYSDFDTDGLPRRTAQSRLQASGSLLDKYTQTHTWNEHGERMSWTMPTYPTFSSFAPWTTTVNRQFDAMGNVVRIERTAGTRSGVFLEADYRDAARPNYRKVTTANTVLSREYGYDGGNGLLKRMALVANGKTVAGSEVEFEGVQRVRARLLGLSGGARADEWIYDARSRLLGSSLARDDGAAPQTEAVTPGDFRAALNRPAASTPADPSTIEYVEDTNGGHKISVMKRGLLVEEFAFHGGERISDGRFRYEYDGKGRLKTVTENKDATTLRRVRYFYDPRGRMVGRRVEYAVVALGLPPQETDWKLEDRPEVLAADALPADTTLVWDPMSDQLVSLFKAGSSEAINPENGGLLRQIIHGGLGYDDPLEVATADPTAPDGVSRLYPVYDEAGGRSLQVVLNDRGEIVARSIAAGPYGEDQAVLGGPAVDKVQVIARKDSAGNVTGIDIVVRSTEDVAEQTLQSGFRVAAVDANGGVVRTASVTPVLDGSAAVRWSLDAAQWAALTAGGGSAISIATTSTARSASWSAGTGFLSAPKWAVETKAVYTSPEVPVDVRESLAGLSQWLASIPAGEEKSSTLYEVPTLYALGAPRIAEGTAVFTGGDPLRLIVSSPFHAHPFQDPFTGQNYVRARWFDLHSGAWLTPDPAGYVDSPNLYTYAGGDPVNSIDPTGMNGEPGEPREESRVRRFFKWLVKEAAATALEELTPVGIANGIVTAVTGYDAVRDEEVEGWFARGLALASAIPGIPSAVRKVDDAVDVAADASRAARHIPTSAIDDVARAAPNPHPRRVRTPTPDPESVIVHHAKAEAAVGREIVEHGFDPYWVMKGKESRFGPAVYVAEKRVTAVKELAAHERKATYMIRYRFDVHKAAVLDLTDPQVAKQLGYIHHVDNLDSPQSIAAAARAAGYDAIKFKSHRGPGNNYAILRRYNELLTPIDAHAVLP